MQTQSQRASAQNIQEKRALPGVGKNALAEVLNEEHRSSHHLFTEAEEPTHKENAQRGKPSYQHKKN